MNVASLIKLIAATAWVVFFGLIVIVVLRASRNKNVKGVVTILLVVLAGGNQRADGLKGLLHAPPAG